MLRYRVLRRPILAIAGFCLIVTGCSFGPNNPNVRNALEMLRIERDAAEDEYYNLKHKHDEALWRIEDLENQLKSIQEESPADFPEPGLDPLQPADDATALLDQRQNLPESAPSVERPNVPETDTVKASYDESKAGDSRSDVDRIVIDKALTRGFDSHGKSGDDGVVIAIEPQDENGVTIPVAAPVTISLIDPSRKGIRQRVGLWKFTARQVAARYDSSQQVFLFRLPWQRNAPINSRLKLFVRFQANDGNRELESDLEVALDDQPRKDWTVVDSDEGRQPETESIPSVASLNGSRSVDGRIHSSNESDSTTAGGGNSGIVRPKWSPDR